jgi:RNA polymerase sigma factor (TIGR02999 family)
MMAVMSDVTQLLAAIEQGDQRAADELLPLVYEELRRLARARMASERAGHTLSATALVHEAYLRLVGGQGNQWNCRGHFFVAAAESMRRILVESARRKQQVGRGGDLQRVPLDAVAVPADAPTDDVVALDESLRRLEEHDSAAASVVKLRYFAGMSMPETAEALGIPLRTAERNWTYARTWLRRDMA